MQIVTNGFERKEELFLTTMKQQLARRNGKLQTAIKVFIGEYYIADEETKVKMVNLTSKEIADRLIEIKKTI